MVATLDADASADIGGVAAVLEAISAGCRQRGLKRRRPLVVGPSEPPDLVRRQAEVAEHRPEWLTGIDSLQELLAYLYWQPALRSGSLEGSLLIAVRLAAVRAAAAAVPACRCAVSRFGHRSNVSAHRSGEVISCDGLSWARRRWSWPLRPPDWIATASRIWPDSDTGPSLRSTRATVSTCPARTVEGWLHILAAVAWRPS
jgi:hypothetical protein